MKWAVRVREKSSWRGAAARGIRVCALAHAVVYVVRVVEYVAHAVHIAHTLARRPGDALTGRVSGARVFVAVSVVARAMSLAVALVVMPVAVRAQGFSPDQAQTRMQMQGQTGKQATNQARPPSTPLQPSPAFAKFPAYTGTLGKRAIVLRLGPESDAADPSGVQGEYQFGDTGQVILVAGDRTGATLEIEESDDGTNITGNWVGTFAADGALSGERMNPDDSSAQPFDLRPAKAKRARTSAKPARTAATAASAKKTVYGRGTGAAGAKSSATPARPPSGSGGVHPVSGASNLTTDD